MPRVVIFGNSGSGKSTLAKSFRESRKLAHLDLDRIAWLPVNPPQRAPLDQSRKHIQSFVEENERWVIEGCYSDLIQITLDWASHLIFLNLTVESCIANAKKRPWEPHKYESKALQDENLEMLIGWIEEYPIRDDPCSLSSHTKLYRECQRIKKIEVCSNLEDSLINAFLDSDS